MKKAKTILALPAIVLVARLLSHLSGQPPYARNLIAEFFLFLLFCGHGRVGIFLKGKYAEESRFPLQSRICCGAARRAARRRGLEHVPAACALPRWKGSHVRTPGKKLLYTLGAWCAVFFTAQIALLFLARPMKSAAGRERQKVSPFLLMKLCVSLFTSERIQPTHSTQGFLLSLTLSFPVWCFNRKSGCMEKYRTKGSRCRHWDNRRFMPRLRASRVISFWTATRGMHFSLPGLF